MRALAAVLDYEPKEVPQSVLPPAWHWLCLLPLHRQSESGVDGHPATGGFLPSSALPRRMWAGSRMEFHSPVRIGDPIARQSVIEDVASKSGRSGELLFVKVRHELQQDGHAVLTEWQDLVYREDTTGPAVSPDSPAEMPALGWSRELTPDEVLLFRFSAMTLNAHRIHYDHAYATQTEGYPGLVVHGPLQALLLLDLVRRKAPGGVLSGFVFRGVASAFCGNLLGLGGQVEGQTVRLVAHDAFGRTSMNATARFAP